MTIAADGTISIDKQPVTRDQVRDVLQNRRNKNSDLVVLINADERVEHGLVVEVMDQARQAGVTRMAIAVKPKDGQP